MDRYIFPEPLRYRLKVGFFKRVWCPLFGHKTITKMSGTILCQRCR